MPDPTPLGVLIVTLAICGLTLVNLVLFFAVVWYIVRPRAAPSGRLPGTQAAETQPMAVAPRGEASLHTHDLNELLGVDIHAIPEGARLIWREGSWQPVASVSERSRQLAHPIAHIQRREARIYECWFTIDGPGNQAEVLDLPASALQVFRETQTGPKYLAKIEVLGIEKLRRNMFEIQLRQESERLRFSLDLLNIPTRDGRSLIAFARENNLQFLGLRGEATVTLHVIGGP
jgi:hypothetical protein